MEDTPENKYREFLNVGLQKKFLHDLATPLAIAMLLIDSLIGEVQERMNANPEDLVRLSEINQALEKLNHLISERRQFLNQTSQ